MNFPLLLLPIMVFTVAGATLKVADHTGEHTNNTTGFSSAFISGLLLGYLTSLDAEKSAIVTGILFGVATARKIDRPNLVLGLIVTVGTAYLLGYVWPSIWLLLVVSSLTLMDELGHGRLERRDGFIAAYFRYRCSLKTAIILVTTLSLISPVNAFGFLGFDFSYDAANWIFSKS